MKHAPQLIVFIAAIILGVACQRTPPMVLGEEPMARLMVDLELAEGLTLQRTLPGYSIDSSRLTLRRSVLAKHGVNEAVLDSSLRWYGAHLPRFLKVLDRADSMLADSTRAFELAESQIRTQAAGDSVNLWPEAPSVIFARSEPSVFLPFEVAQDSTWKFGDVFTMTFAIDNALSPVAALLAVDYGNRNLSTDAVARRQYPGDERHFELRLQLDSNYVAKRVYGYLQLNPKPGERAVIDSIRLIRTRLIHDDYAEFKRPARRFHRNDR